MERAGRLSLYDGAGHSPFFEDPTRFNRELAVLVRAAPHSALASARGRLEGWKQTPSLWRPTTSPALLTSPKRLLVRHETITVYCDKSSTPIKTIGFRIVRAQGQHSEMMNGVPLEIS
jgi:hypothetical protein